MSEFKLSVDEFLDRAASSAPTPGGGGVAALAGALGAAMVSMVANLTTGRRRFQAVEKEAVALRRRAVLLMADFKALARADISAFSVLMDAFRMPRNTAEDRVRRAEAVGRAARAATEVPLQTAARAVEALRLAHAIALIGNENAVSDAGVAACMAEAAAAGALLNVDINLPLVDDADFRSASVTARDSLQAEAATLKARTLAVVKDRIG